MTAKERYFELCYTLRIHEFSKIDSYNKCEAGESKMRYKTLNDFYLQELGINQEELDELRKDFEPFNTLYSKYYNDDRRELFSNPDLLSEWYAKQNKSCKYCGVTQEDLLKIVDKRNGNLTLNQRTKRSKGTLEIEKLNPSLGYTFSNSVLACPFCNNAKSNLISESDWREYFVPAMKKYLYNTLTESQKTD